MHAAYNYQHSTIFNPSPFFLFLSLLHPMDILDMHLRARNTKKCSREYPQPPKRTQCFNTFSSQNLALLHFSYYSRHLAFTLLVHLQQHPHPCVGYYFSVYELNGFYWTVIHHHHHHHHHHYQNQKGAG